MLINSRARQKTLSYVSLTSWRPHGKRRQKHARCFEGDSSAACSSMIEPECLCYRQFMNQTGSSSSNLDVKHGCRKDTPPPWVLHEAVFLRRRHANEVQGVPDVREVAETIQGVGVLPGGLHLRQFRGSAVPTLAGPRRVLPVYEAKRIAMPP